jgi:hypothetical protein
MEETVSHVLTHHHYESGFDGVLAAFRISSNQNDWTLAKGVEGIIPWQALTATASSNATRHIAMGNPTGKHGAIQQLNPSRKRGGTRTSSSPLTKVLILCRT